MEPTDSSSPLIVPQQNTPNESSRSLNIKMYGGILGIIILVTMVGIGAFFLIRKPPPPAKTIPNQKQPTPTPSPIPNIHGTMTYIQSGNVYVYKDNQISQLTTDASFTQTGATINTPFLLYSYPSLSPDGKKIIYFQTTSPASQQDPTTVSLYVSNIDGTGRLSLINNGPFDLTGSGFPAQWLNDNQNVLIGVANSVPGTTITGSYNLVKLNIISGTQQKLLTYSIIPGCSNRNSSNYDPSKILSGSEGLQPINSPVFQIASGGANFINNIDCAGFGVGIHNLQTNQATSLTENLSQAQLSPDGNQIAGVTQNNQIQIYNTQSGNLLNSLTTSIQPQTIYWSKNGKTIYYSTFTLTQSISSQPDALGNTVKGDEHIASLWSISIDGTNNNKLIDFNSYSIKPLYVSADTTSALVEQIDNPTKYLQALNKVGPEGLTPLAPITSISSVDLTASISSVILRDAKNPIFYQN